MKYHGYNGFNGQIGASNGMFGGSNGQFGGSNGNYSGYSSSQSPRNGVSPAFTPSVANMVHHGGYQGIQSGSCDISSPVSPNWYWFCSYLNFFAFVGFASNFFDLLIRLDERNQKSKFFLFLPKYFE